MGKSNWYCTSKAGKSFDCRFVLDENKEVKFEFEEKYGNGQQRN